MTVRGRRLTILFASSLILLVAAYAASPHAPLPFSEWLWKAPAASGLRVHMASGLQISGRLVGLQDSDVIQRLGDPLARWPGIKHLEFFVAPAPGSTLPGVEDNEYLDVELDETGRVIGSRLVVLTTIIG